MEWLLILWLWSQLPNKEEKRTAIDIRPEDVPWRLHQFFAFLKVTLVLMVLYMIGFLIMLIRTVVLGHIN